MKFNEKYCYEYFDNYNIHNLIKKINKHYRLYLNKKDNCFFIVNIAKNYEICMVFYNFNKNIIKSLTHSRVENSKQLFQEIEEHNQLLELKNKQTLKDKAADELTEINNFSKRVNHLSKQTLNKIIGADLC